jgi:hypothetical protein
MTKAELDYVNRRITPQKVEEILSRLKMKILQL